MKPNNCKQCGSSRLRPMHRSDTGEKWVACDSCGNNSTPLITNNSFELIAKWNAENENN